MISQLNNNSFIIWQYIVAIILSFGKLYKLYYYYKWNQYSPAIWIILYQMYSLEFFFFWIVSF